MRHSWIWIAGLLALAACNGGGSGETAERARTPKDGGDFTPVIATLGDWEITQGYFDYRYERLTPAEKARFSGENWKERFLDYLLEESLLYKAAKDENYHRLPEIERQLDFQTRSVVVMGYHNQKFKQEIEIPEDAVQEYYDANQDEFQVAGRALGYHIQTATEQRIREAHQELEEGKRFASVALKYSEDTHSKDNGGLLGWFNPGGYVLGMGFNQDFTDLAFSLEPGKYSDPVKLGDKWHIVMIGGKSENQIEPLAEVRDRIVAKLRPIYGKEAYANHLEDLRDRYGVERFGEFQAEEVRTPEQLYRLAAESRNAYAKIDYYDALVEHYPDDERADEAQFMIGFLYSEEFADVPWAHRSFRKLIREYPDSEYVEQARWMMQNLGRKEPRLMTEGAPANAEEARERIEGVSQ